MIRILRILNRFNLGGPVLNAAYLTKYISDKYETKLIGGLWNSDETSAMHVIENLGIEATVIPEMKRSVNIFNDLKAYQKIKKIISEYKPHIVHTHASKAGFIGRVAAFNSNTPIVVHTFHGHVFHSYFNGIQTGSIKQIERILARKSNAIVAISQRQKNELCAVHRVCEDNKTHVIPLGFDLSKFENNPLLRNKFRKKYVLSDSDVAIGIIGRLVPIKNHALFIKGFGNALKNTNKRIVGFIIGDGRLKNELWSLAMSLNIPVAESALEANTSGLIFTSWEKEIHTVLPGLDIVALTSHNEGTPVSLIEALACEKTVLSSIVGGVEDYIQHSKNGYLFDSNNEEQFSTILSEILNQKLILSELKSGSQFIKESYSYKRLVNDTEKLYEFLLKN